MARSRFLLAATLLVALPSRFLFAADVPASPTSKIPTEENAVELPTVTITDSKILPLPEAWRYAKYDGFEILSNASDHETRQLLRDFVVFRQALSLAWPIESRESLPVTLILCGKENKFDDFVDRPIGAEPNRASLLLKDLDRISIVIDLQRKAVTLSAVDSSAGAATTDAGAGTFDVDHHSLLYREYVKFLLSRSDPPLPAWLQEGLAQIVMAMEFTPNSVIFGRIGERGQGGSSAPKGGLATTSEDESDTAEQSVPDLDFNLALTRQRLLPFHAFFDVKPDSPVAQNVVGNTRWSKQAYAFVHLCLYGEGGRYQKAFLTLAQRASRGPLTEEIFKDCFGKSYDKMLLELRGYIEMTDYKYQQFKIKGQGFFQPPALDLRDASDAEVGRIKGDAFRAAHRLPQAHDALAAAYLRGERDPALLGALGLYEATAGNAARAQKFLEAAAKAKITRPTVYLEEARLLYAEALAHPGTVQGQFSSEQAITILRPLFATRNQSPPLAEVYELIADTWSHCVIQPKREHLAVLSEGVKLFPRHSELVFKTAALNAKSGYFDTAATVAALGEQAASDPATKTRFQALVATFPKPDAKTSTSEAKP